MIKTVLSAFLLIATALPAAAEMQVLLRLTQLSDDAPVTQITVMGNTIDPNTRSVDDRFEILLNGHVIRTTDDLAATLSNARRAYSYDNFTRGIVDDRPTAMCMMAGPAQGWILETLYLTYGDNSQITGTELRPVLSEASNCLFPHRIHPSEREAHVAAAKALATLQTIARLQ